MFSQACVQNSVHRRGDMCGIHTPWACMSPQGTHTHLRACTHPPGMHAPWHVYPLSGCHEMRSMSRQYASYWNAFLLLVKSCTQCAEGILNEHVLYLFPGVHEKFSLFINCIFKYSSPINYVPSFLDKRSRIPWLEITFCVFWSFV